MMLHITRLDAIRLRGTDLARSLRATTCPRRAAGFPRRPHAVWRDARAARSALLQAADFTGTKLAGANLVAAVITNVRGQIPQQYYDENANLTPIVPMRYPAGAFPLTSCFDDATTCPNGLPFAANNTLAQMMARKNPPTSWSPPFKRPLDVHGPPTRPRRHGAAAGRRDTGRQGRRPSRRAEARRTPPTSLFTLRAIPRSQPACAGRNTVAVLTKPKDTAMRRGLPRPQR
jgi:hypothetical protein